MFKKSLLVAVSLMALAGTSQAGEILDKIKATGTVNIGYRESSLPYSLKANNDEAIGYSIDVCKEIIRDLEKTIGKPLETKKQTVAAAARIALIKNKSIDLECAGTTKTEDRAEVADFAIHNADPITIAVQSSNNKITKVEDLKNLKAAVVTGITGEKILRNLNAKQNYNMEIIPAKDYPMAFILLGQGRADFTVTNESLIDGEISKNAASGKFKKLDITIGEPEMIGIMLPKVDPEFTALVQKSLANMKKDGRLEKLHDKWFAQPLPNGVNLNLKWTKELKDLVWAEK